MLQKRIDPYTNEEFVPTRQNQIFSATKNRIAYHNEKNFALNKELRAFNNQLKKNFMVFNSLIGDADKITVNRNFLRGAGFSFKTYTHLNLNGADIVYGLYNFSFHKVNEEEYLIYRAK